MHIEHPPISIRDCSYYHDGEYFNGKIYLNLKECERYAKKTKIEFSEFIARVLNHEFLHHLFKEEHDEYVSHDLDNIAKRLKDFWLW